MLVKHRLSCGLLAGLLALSLTACGGNSASSSNAASISETTSSAQQESTSYAYVQGVTQTTRYGTVEGFAEDGALHWYGVPYAQAPVGELRWKAPQPLQPWEGTLEATESLAASQTASSTRAGGVIGSPPGRPG